MTQQLPYGIVPGPASFSEDERENMFEQVYRLLAEIYDDGDNYPFKNLTEDQQKRIENQFDRRYALMIG